jgi:tripartite-type tricarboxylate transporter receptor subunit TctC
MRNIRKLVCAFGAVVLACASGVSVLAEQPSNTYPTKPVRIIMPLGPGNSLEIALRPVADKLGTALGQPFIIEAHPGAAGQIGAVQVARAAADGYTLLAANDGVITVLPNLQKNVQFEPIRDFAPITALVGVPFVLIAHPSVPAKTAQELVALAKARPGALEFSSGGVGSVQQLVMELFMASTGTKFVHVPYKGAPQAALDVVSGQIPVAMAGVPIVASLIKEGKLRALGIASDQRLPLLPDTPTLAEQGIPVKYVAWQGLFAPAGTASEILHKLSQESVRALKSAEMQERFAKFGFETYGTSPEEFAAIIKADFAKAARVIHEAGIISP